MTENYNLKEGLLIQNVLDEMVILEPESGEYYTLNSVGALMMSMAQKGMDQQEIVSIICEEYDADETVVMNDLVSLYQDLEQHGLAQKSEDK